MGPVMVDLSVSVDGFIAGPNDGPDNPLGDGPAALGKLADRARSTAGVFLTVALCREIGSTAGCRQRQNCRPEVHAPRCEHRDRLVPGR